MDRVADAVLRGPIGEILPALVHTRVSSEVGGSRKHSSATALGWLNPDLTGRLSAMATFRDLLSAAKAEITEVDTASAAERIAAGALVLDVREPDEYDAGRAPRRRAHPPRPPRVAGREQADRQGRAGRRLLRRRRALGVRRPHDGRARLHRRRLDGRRVRPVEGRGPGVEEAGRAHRGAAQPLQAPPAAARGRRRGPGQAARLEGAAARRRRPRLTRRALPRRRRGRARSASSTWTRSTPRTCSARSCTTSTASATARSTRRRRRSSRSTPTSTSSPTTPGCRPTTSSTSSPATTSSSTAPTTSRAGTCSTTPA